MATKYAWADDAVPLNATVKGERFKDVKDVVFVFTEGETEVDRTKVELDKKTGLASGKWEKAKGPEAPALFRKLNYHLEIDGKPLKNFPDEIHVFARKLAITAKGPDDKPMANAMCRIKQKAKDAPKEAKGGIVKRTDKDGKIEWELVRPAPVEIVWEPPYFLLDKKWLKEGGIEWEAKLEHILPVKFVWPSAEAAKQPHKQYVNLPASKDNPEYGPTVKVKVGPGDEGKLPKGRKVFLKAEFSDANSEREAMKGGKKKGETLTLDTTVDDKGEAHFDVPVGVAGGDRVRIAVGSTDEVLDGFLTVETWRKLFYELSAPDCMSDRLEQRKIDGKDRWDLKQTTREWATARLEKVFVEYDNAATHRFADDKVKGFLHEGAFLEKPAGTYYVLGSPAAYGKDPVPFGKGDPRTIFVRCCDVAADGNPPEKVELEVAQNDFETNVPVIFKVDPGTGKPSITKVTWTAVVDPAADPKHPGVNKGKPRTGKLPESAIELLTWKKARIHLTGEAAALVGAPDDQHCKIKVAWTWITGDTYNGSASGGRQLMNLGRPLKPVAATICHELGHSMGMTILDDPATYKGKPPEGMPMPDPVPAGLYYEGKGHTGPHCAFGLSDDEKAKDSYRGLQGTCIMFGSGGNEEEPKRGDFCPTCITYLKGRNLSDIKQDYWDRKKSKLDQGG